MILAPAALLAGVRVEHIAPDCRAISVALRPRWYRFGLQAPHDGATLYAMVDPFFLWMMQRALGGDYLVWDKAGSIDVLAPGRGRVWARLDLRDDDLRHIQKMTDSGDKHLHLFVADIRDADGMMIARVEKMIYVRRKGHST
jgi:hypothetical protein